MSRLVARARRFSDSMPETDVVPVVVTSLSRASIPAGDMENAAYDSVSIVAREGLTDLLRELRGGASVDQITALLRGMIPRRRQGARG